MKTPQQRTAKELVDALWLRATNGEDSEDIQAEILLRMSKPEPSREIEAWKRSTERLAEFMSVWEENRGSNLSDDEICVEVENFALTAGHLREVIALCRTK